MFDLFSGPSEVKPLRPYQAKAVELVRQSLRTGHKRPVLKVPTGGGKTRIASEIVNMALAKGNPVAFTVPAISLIGQTIEAFAKEGITRVNVIQGNHPRRDPYAQVHIISVQSLINRDRPDVGIVISDECHMRHKAIADWMAAHPNLPFVGLSATPWAKGMADQWDDLLVPVTIGDLIRDGYLSQFRVFAPSHPDLSAVRRVAGDFHEAELSAVMQEGKLVADVVDTWKAKAYGLPTLVFAVDRAHAQLLQKQFAAAGVQMGYCDAFTDLIERGVLFSKMKRGEIAGICNVGTLTTGVDADVRCVVLARPTRSEMLFVQMIGRALRPADGKQFALILDHADNHARMGFVTDIHHDKLLSGSEPVAAPRAEKGEKTPKECPKCGALRHGRECFACGFTAERQSEVETVAGELVEMKSRKKGEPTAEDKARFWGMALHLDAERGKGGGLAKALFKAKFKHWPDGLANVPVQPDDAFMGYERSRRIAHAKWRARK